MKKLLASLLLTSNAFAGITSIPIGDKVTICHYPPGNTKNVQVLTISQHVVSTHINHHLDVIYNGSCPDYSPILVCSNNITSTADRSLSSIQPNTLLAECNNNPISPDGLQNFIPDQPVPLINQYKKLDSIEYCVDGGVKSDSILSNGTIKRASVINANVTQYNIELNNTKLVIGEILSGDVDISHATQIDNKLSNVDISNAIISNASVDTMIDFVNPDGTFRIYGTFISVYGGKLQTQYVKENQSVVHHTIVSGMITSGINVTGDPIRGSITAGKISESVLLNDTASVHGRRFRGEMQRVSLTDASIITFNGKQYVDGIITQGTGSGSVFGSIYNATFTNVDLLESNSCFSSGNVGTRSQLNWKEVVK